MANEQNLNPFKKGQSGNPKGRPKKIENVLNDYFLDEHNVKLSKSQTQDIIKTILGKTRKELVDLAKNDDLPFWVALIVNKAQRDFKKGSMHVLDVLFDRVYGKPKEEIDQNIIAENFDKIEVTIVKPDND
jgi:hypothetical protein